MPKKNNNLDINIRAVALDRVKRHLESAVDDAVQTKDLQGLAERVRNIILLRTQRGYFLDGSGGKERRQYQSETHKQRRASLGLSTGHVTLFMGELGLLEAMMARGMMSLGKPTIKIGYEDGLTEEKANEIAGYMNDEGIGPNRITYPYIGLTDKENKTAIDYLRGRVGGNLKRQYS